MKLVKLSSLVNVIVLIFGLTLHKTQYLFTANLGINQ